MAMKKVFFIRTLMVLMLGGYCSSCAVLPGEIGLPSAEKDRELGQEVAKQIETELGIVDSNKTTAYLKAVGERLDNVLSDQRFDYSFSLVDQYEPNAFAAPGGWVYFTRGIVALTNSEDELATVMGHEMTHVYLRHTARQMTKARLPGLFTLPGKIVGGVISEDIGNLLNAPVTVLGAAYIAQNSRADEYEADQGGQDLAAGAGYDPAALATILDRLERFVELETGEKRIPGFFDTHPSTPDRVERVAKYAQGITRSQQSGVVKNTDEHLHKLEGLLVGENPAMGVFLGQKFLHPNLDISIKFPAGWKTMNTPQAVTAISPKEDGLLVLGIDGEGTDPKQAASKLIKTMEKKYRVKPHIETIDASQEEKQLSDQQRQNSGEEENYIIIYSTESIRKYYLDQMEDRGIEINGAVVYGMNKRLR